MSKRNNSVILKKQMEMTTYLQIWWGIQSVSNNKRVKYTTKASKIDLLMYTIHCIVLQVFTHLELF